MPLEPGDRGVLAVAPWEDAERSTEWTCARCAEPFISADVWRVDYRHPEGGASSYLTCRRCAKELEPLRVTIDLNTLRRAAGEERLSTLADLAERTAENRAGPGTGVVRLRWSDLYEVADAHGRTPEELADELEEVGALVSRGQGFRRDFDLPASTPEQHPPPA